MLDALKTTLNGMNAAVSRATHSANNIVNASSTGKNLDNSLVELNVAKTDYAAGAAVVKTVDKMHKALLDIIA